MKKGLSLRWKMLIVFSLVCIFIVVGFFLMNTFFWNGIYSKTNQKNIKETYETLKTLYQNGNTTEQEIQDAIWTKQAAYAVTVAVQGDSDWEFTVYSRQNMSPRERDFLMTRLQDNFLRATKEEVKVLETGDGYTLQKVNLSGSSQDRSPSAYYECYGYIRDAGQNERKFIISMPLANLERAKESSNRFFVSISIAILLIGGLIIVLITEQICKPITGLSRISVRMRNLDFSARYTGKQTDEVGVLGNNMNQLSETLEKTIQELKVANEQLQKDLKEKEEIDEMRKEFISNVSHELKTPIALIQGYAEGLKDLEDSPEEMDYYIDVITDESDKMNRMVKKLMNLNQLEFGKTELTKEPFSLSEMGESVLRTFEKKATDTGVTTEFHGIPGDTVLGDAFEIEEVITNYLQNAFNHVAGEKRISLSVTDEGSRVRLTVFNTGERIPEEELPKIWIKFYKVDKARTRAYGGSGIGLSIVKAVMDAHKEPFGVENCPDGVRFWLELTKQESHTEETSV